MKFSSFKEFRQAISSTIEDVVSYLNTDITKIIRELNIGLTRLNLSDNFESFVKTVTIPATSELAIRNELQGGRIPSHWIKLRSDTGGIDVVDGDAVWNANYVYLKNTGASSATVTVVFLK